MIRGTREPKTRSSPRESGDLILSLQPFRTLLMNPDEPLELMSPAECLARFAVVRELDAVCQRIRELHPGIANGVAPSPPLDAETITLFKRLKELGDNPLAEPSTLPLWLQRQEP